jgi:hypothetical protein
MAMSITTTILEMATTDRIQRRGSSPSTISMQMRHMTHKAIRETPAMMEAASTAPDIPAEVIPAEVAAEVIPAAVAAATKAADTNR